MTEFTPGDRTVWWDNLRTAELVKDYLLLFASKSTFEAYLFALVCKSEGIASLHGSASTEKEALDLIEDSGCKKLICFISDDISPDCGTKIALSAKASNQSSYSFLIVNDPEKCHSLAIPNRAFAGLCSSSSIGRGGLYQCLNASLCGGNLYVDPLLVHAFVELDERGVATLNSRERDVLGLVAQGLSNKEIAQKIFIAERTVRDYVSSILHKLNVANRAGAAAWAIRHGFANS
jgi:DNA-binding NarL/FixJ family response regulator